jgi:fluoroacetyl-CoA thioesterase
VGRPSPGEEAEIEVTVTEDMLVDLGGRRIHPVYATAWLVRHMEEAGRALVERHLDPGEDATGYSISLVHHSPARPGDTLTVTATATGADERSCEARIEVHGPRGMVGRGTLVQRYIKEGQLSEGGMHGIRPDRG